MRDRTQVAQELLAADLILNDPRIELRAHQFAYLSGVAQALKWVLGLDETGPPTKGF